MPRTSASRRQGSLTERAYARLRADKRSHSVVAPRPIGEPTDGEQSSRGGAGRLLIAAYAILALAATGRSTYQLLTQFHTAPIPYSLSAVSAVIYVVAGILIVLAQARVTPLRRRLAWFAVGLESVGILVVGIWSTLDQMHFPADTVWSGFGRGYGYLPAILPILGMAWLESTRPRGQGPAARPHPDSTRKN